MGARLRGDRPCHRHRAAGAAERRRDRCRDPGRAFGHRSTGLPAPMAAPDPEPEVDPASLPDRNPLECLERLLASPALASKRWIWEQYDHLVMGNTVIRPGGNAAVIRVSS